MNTLKTLTGIRKYIKKDPIRSEPFNKQNLKTLEGINNRLNDKEYIHDLGDRIIEITLSE